jgi:hypothetical protein
MKQAVLYGRISSSDESLESQFVLPREMAAQRGLGILPCEYHLGTNYRAFCVRCDVFRCTSLCWNALQRRFMGHLSRR